MEFRGREQEGLRQAWCPWFSHRIQRYPPRSTSLRLLAASQRHSWDASGRAEGTCLPFLRQALDSLFSLPDASSNTGNSGTAGSPSQAVNFPSAGNVQLGVAGNVQLGLRGGPASALTLGRLQWSRPRPWCGACTEQKPAANI